MKLVTALVMCALTSALSGPRRSPTRRRGRKLITGARGATRQAFHGPLQRIVRAHDDGMVSNRHDYLCVSCIAMFTLPSTARCTAPDQSEARAGSAGEPSGKR